MKVREGCRKTVGAWNILKNVWSRGGVDFWGSIPPEGGDTPSSVSKCADQEQASVRGLKDLGWDGIGCLVEGGQRDTEEHRHWLRAFEGSGSLAAVSWGHLFAAWRGGSPSTGPWGAPCLTEAGWDWEFSIMTDKIQRGLWVEHWAGRVENSK